MAKAINKTGNKARDEVRKNLRAQTGLPDKTMRKALRITRPTPANLEYTITTEGGDIALIYFKPRETRKGVSAAPFGQRKVFPHTFIKGGRFPHASRKPLSMGGHVFEPDTGNPRWGRKFKKAVSDVAIPEQMVIGASREAWDRVVEKDLADNVAREIERLLSKG